MTTDRLEKYMGVTLVVRDSWITVVWDATGHSVEGPVKDDADVKRIARIAVETLRQLAGVQP